ncbi:MAG TPA: hypothetical protein VFV52_12160 [Bacilli bacterium]|nr:hypothetical protein [Bacilli bacterium]
MKIRTKSGRLALSAVLAATLIGGSTQAAFADSAAEVSVDVVGWDGSFKETAWTPVRVQVKNTGDDLTGHVVVESSNTGYNGSPVRGTFEKEVVVPQGGTKEVTVLVPGYLFQQPVNVRLYDEDGDEVDLQKNIVRTPLTDTLLVGGVMAKTDDLNVFSLVPSSTLGGRVSVKQLAADDLPDRPELLNGLDLLVINHAPQDELTQGQLDAVEDWVADGGKLLLSGGAGYNGGGSLFADLSPVEVNGSTTLTDLSGLASYVHTPLTVKQLTVSTGAPKQQAKVLAASGGVPLLADRRYGAGHVLYAAYDLSEEPLASWQGNKDLWSNVFGQAELSVAKYNPQYTGIDPMGAVRMLLVNSSQFEALIPSIQTILIMFGIYLLLIGPILYLLLRRLNKREWGWGLIPGAAVLFSLGIYFWGANPMQGAIGQYISQVDLKTPQSATVKSAGSFIVTHGGDYAVDLPADTLAFAGMSGYNSMSRDMTGSRTLQHADGTQILYDNVEYFTTRSAYVEARLKNKGQVENNLHLDKDGYLRGTLTNKSAFDLEQTFLIVGTSAIDLGELKAGESTKVEERISSITLVKNKYGSGMLTNKLAPVTYGPFGINGDHDQMLKRNLAEFATNPMNLGDASLQLFAFSHTPLDLYRIQGEKVSDDSYISLIRQEMELQSTDDATMMPPGMIRGRIIEQTGQIGLMPEGVHILDGTVGIQYNVKIHDKFIPEKVQIDLDKAVYAVYFREYFNWQSGEWEKVTEQNESVLTGVDLQKYVSGDGKLNVRLSGDAGLNGGQVVSFPNVGVEGKVAR